MRVRKLLLIAAASAGLAAGCAKPQPAAPAVDLAAEAQAVRDRSAAWLQMAQARDTAGIASGVFAANATTLYADSISHGAADIQAAMNAEDTAMPNSTVNWSTTDVQVAGSGDLAYELGTFTFDPDGAGEAAALDGEYVTVWTKADGSWRAIVDSSTARKAAVAPAGG